MSSSKWDLRSTGWIAALSVATLAASCGGTVAGTSEQPGAGGAAGTGGAAGAGGTLDAGLGGTGHAGAGGTLPEAATCFGPNPAGCFNNGVGCPAGYSCEATGCAASYCVCEGAQQWVCTNDCAGGTCVTPDGSVPKSCGGVAGETCGPTEFCDFDDAAASYCGGDDSTGTCQPRPSGCYTDCPGACACDGIMYCNACLAHAAGFDDGAKGCTWPDAGLDCQGAMQLVAGQMKAMACTTVVRVAYDSLGLLGYQVLCGGFTKLDEAKARAVAQADTGFGLNAESLAGPDPADVFVFRQPPWDFGGVGVVSAHTGLSVFGGSIVWSGTGAITWPVTPWQPPGLMGGPECAVAMWPSWRGFDLSEGAYTDAAAQLALQAAWNTALPAGISTLQYITEAVVLLYPRTVGKFNGANAEWIVLLNSQWLE
jgi:hypothetical protein